MDSGEVDDMRLLGTTRINSSEDNVVFQLSDLFKYSRESADPCMKN